MKKYLFILTFVKPKKSMNFSSNGTTAEIESLFYPHKYNCSNFEQFLMVLITAITNLAFTPALILLIRKKYYFPVFFGLFTQVTSFMYHFMESIALKKFLNMDEGQWHKLDNIGSIVCFMSLAVYLMDNRNQELDLILNYIALIITLILQESDPWNIFCTIIPILSYFILIHVLSWKRGRKAVYNKKMHRLALVGLFPALFCFYNGLDEFQDYLRFYHGFWHFFVGVSSFFIWQCKTPEGEETYISTLLSKKVYTEIKYNID